ncbi:lysoplasmalogenase [Agromyces bracchium]|uniref:Lysoplasmalogenase n=1 Tax=Agromyces bracchium TaxID=88376 RepID=A0A6I3M975_9MICO|nr:lysoplasmalogenase [Agromyces bracchium]MTH68672.1 lysoplasmalogenase [Agromyces bracchium]
MTPSAPAPVRDEALLPPAPLARADRRRLLVAFAPYVLLSLVHLVVLVGGVDGAAVTATKLLLMPALVVAVLVARPRASATTWLLITALILSWGGDALLTGSGDGWFVAGLLSFLAAHVAYVVLFVRLPAAGRRLPWWALAYVAWFAAFLALLAPGLGGLLVPVAVYGAVLGTMAALAGGLGGAVAFGGALFVVSDSVLALGRFLPGYEFAAHDLVVMSTYLAAQGLIAFGVLTRRVSAQGR